MLRCLVFVLSLLVWGPIFSQKGNIQIFPNSGYPFTTSELGDKKYVRFFKSGDSLFDSYRVFPNGNFEPDETKMWRYRGDTLFNFPIWTVSEDEFIQFGWATIKDSIYKLSKPFLNIYDSDMQLKKHVILPGDEFFRPLYQPIIYGESVYFPAVKVDKDSSIINAILVDTTYSVKWDFVNGIVTTEPEAINFSDFDIIKSVKSANGKGLLLFNGFGNRTRDDVVYYWDLVGNELSLLNINFTPNQEFPSNQQMLGGDFYQNPNESDTAFCYRNRYPLVLDDYPNFQNDFPESDYLYYFNDKAEILGHSKLRERDYRFFLPAYTNTTIMSGELFRQVGRFFSAVSEPYDSINPATGELFEDGYMYFVFDFVNSKFIEQRYISREDGVGDYYANPTFNHMCYGDFIFKDTVTLIQHSSLSASVDYNNLFSIAISDMTLALPEISGKQLNFSVYPNPSTEKIRVLGSNKGTYQIFNVSGQEVKSGVFYERESIPIGFLSSGEYIIRVQEENISGSFKFVKE